MYNNLWDQSPIIQRMKAQSEAKGEVKALQKTIVNLVSARFPHLADLAQQRATQLNNVEKLDKLIIQISKVPDEANMRLLLAPTVA
jgi:hypothetical protein